MALLLSLPKTEEGKSSQAKEKQLVIELSKDVIAIDGKKVEMEAVAAIFEATDKKSLINLRVDGEVQYDRLVRILDLLQKNQLENVNLITEKSRLKK